MALTLHPGKLLQQSLRKILAALEPTVFTGPTFTMLGLRKDPSQPRAGLGTEQLPVASRPLASLLQEGRGWAAELRRVGTRGCSAARQDRSSRRKSRRKTPPSVFRSPSRDTACRAHIWGWGHSPASTPSLSPLAPLPPTHCPWGRGSAGAQVPGGRKECRLPVTLRVVRTHQWDPTSTCLPEMQLIRRTKEN